MLRKRSPPEFVEAGLEVLIQNPRVAKRFAKVIHNLECISDLLFERPSILGPNLDQDGVNFSIKGVKYEPCRGFVSVPLSVVTGCGTVTFDVRSGGSPRIN